MKKTSTRFLPVLAVLLVAALVLSACGGSKSSSATNGGNTDGTTELIWYTIGPSQQDLQKVQEKINEYTKEKIGVTVKMTMIDYGDYNQKMQVLTASGTPMDIVFTSAGSFDYVQNARKGAFKPIDDLLKTQGQGIVKELNPAFLEGSKVDGHNYGVPANKELPSQDVWRFNKTLLDKYNLDISKVRDLNSLEPLLKTIKEKEPTVVPLAMDKMYMPILPFDYLIDKMPMAVYLDTKDYKIVDVLETPELKEALTTMHKYYQAGYISPEAATTTSLNDLQLSGKWFSDRAQSQPLADNLWSESYGYPVVSKPTTDPTIYNMSVMGSLQAISANSKHPEKAMEFLNLLNTDKTFRNLVDSGIEGEHYEKISDNVMKNLPASKNYDMPSYSLGNNMLLFLGPNDAADKWEQFKKFNDSGKASPLLGFNFDSTKVATQIASLQNVKEQYWAPLMTGTVDPNEYLPKAIEQFKAAGIDDIIAEAQRQLDEWHAAQK